MQDVCLGACLRSMVNPPFAKASVMIAQQNVRPDSLLLLCKLSSNCPIPGESWAKENKSEVRSQVAGKVTQLRKLRQDKLQLGISSLTPKSLFCRSHLLLRLGQSCQ